MESRHRSIIATTASGATWQEVAAGMQQYRDNSMRIVEPHLPLDLNHLAIPLNVTGIPIKILTPLEIEITELPVETLVKSLAEGTYTACKVVNAYLRRAGVAQMLVWKSFRRALLMRDSDLTCCRQIVLPNCYLNVRWSVRLF